jgi:hypothetical protein
MTSRFVSFKLKSNLTEDDIEYISDNDDGKCFKPIFSNNLKIKFSNIKEPLKMQ